MFTAPSAHINTLIWPAAFIFLSYSSYDRAPENDCSTILACHLPPSILTMRFLSPSVKTHTHTVSVCTPTQKGLHCISTQLTDSETNSFKHFWLLIDTGHFCVHDLPDTIKWTEKNCMSGAITFVTSMIWWMTWILRTNHLGHGNNFW